MDKSEKLNKQSVKKSAPQFFFTRACLNGHKVTGSTLEDFCVKTCPFCEADILSVCPNCGARIIAWSDSEDLAAIPFISEDRVFSYCYRCGEAYPWTNKAMGRK